MPLPDPLPLLLIRDDKPGHYQLSEALVTALARRRKVLVERLTVTRPSWLFPRLLAEASNRSLPGLANRLGLDFSALKHRPAVVISAGGDTLAGNVLAARRFGASNVFYGSLRRYRPDDFTLALTSYANRATHPNIVMTLKPSSRDPDAMRVPPPRPGEPLTIGVLVGGDSGTVRFSNADWDALLRLLAQGNRDTFCLTVANSRRTPPAVSDRFASLAAVGTIGFIDVRTAGPGTLDPLFAASQAILATVDSSSMISEAVWARRPVVVLAPSLASLPADEQGYRDWMSAHGWTSTLPLAEAHPSAIETALAALTPPVGNPLDALARLLTSRLEPPDTR